MIRSARAIQIILLIAVLLIAPFAILEIYLVTTIGMTEPYSYIWSIPLGFCSFILIQIAPGFGYSAKRSSNAVNSPRPLAGEGLGGEGRFCSTHKRKRSSTASVCSNTS